MKNNTLKKPSVKNEHDRSNAQNKNVSFNFAKQLLLLGGSSALIGLYYFSSQYDEENESKAIFKTSDMLHFGINQALTLASHIAPILAKSAVSLTALVGVAFHLNAQNIRMGLPLAGANILPYMPTTKASKVSKFFKKNWKNWNSIDDIYDRLNNAVDDIIPNEIKPFLDGAKIEAKTDGDTAVIQAKLAHGPAVTLYTSEEPTKKVIEPLYFNNENSAENTAFPAAEISTEAAHAHEQEALINAGIQGAKAMDNGVPGLAGHFARGVSIVNGVFELGARATDPKFQDEHPVAKLACAAWGCTVENTGGAIATTVGAALGGPGGAISAAGGASELADNAGDHAQQNCHDVVNIFCNKKK